MLDTFNHLNLLPSSSYIYKSLQNKISIEFDITVPLATSITSNIKQFFNERTCFYTIKMDEIALVEKIRYDRKKNLFVGSCSNHKLPSFSYEFNNWTDLDFLHDSLISQETHLANEALVITLSSLGTSDNYPRPVLISPICNHSNDNLVRNAIKEIVSNFHSLNTGSHIVNVATDGDTSRRKTLNSLRSPQTHLTVLHRLPLFDQNLLLGRYGINFDAKHLIKRLRSLIISSKRDVKLIQVKVNRFSLGELLKDCPEAQRLMNIKDKQNVPAAVQLLMLIKKKTDNPSECSLNLIQRDVYNEFQLFGLIGSLLCSIFYETKTTLLDQLVKLAYLSHILLYVFRKNHTSFFTTNLYTDIQSTIQDAFVCAAIFQKNSSELKLYLFMLGTDQLENLFGVVRTLSHASSCDLLEFTDRVKIALQIEKVIIL